MWVLNNKNFLFYECFPELVVYNQVTRETSLLCVTLSAIYQIFKESHGIKLSQKNVIDALAYQYNFEVDDAAAKINLEALEKISLIEPV